MVPLPAAITSKPAARAQSTISQINAGAMSYAVDGRQYVAVPVGWGGWAEGFLPGMFGAGHGSALIVFALPDPSLNGSS